MLSTVWLMQLSCFHIQCTPCSQNLYSIEWGYIQRIIAGAESHFHPLKEVLMGVFLPKLTTLNLTSDEKHLMCKPVRHLGIGIVDPVFEAPLAFDNSQECTKMLTDAIRTGIVIDCDAYEHLSLIHI